MDTVVVFRTGLYGTWREKFGGMADFARGAGWRLHPVDARAARPKFRELIDYWKPVGAIVDASSSPEVFDGADWHGLPVVFMNPGGEPSGRRVASVESDSVAIAKLALGELLGGNPASLAFVDWYHRRRWSEVKRREAARVAAMHGLPLTVVTPEPGDAADTTRLERRIASALKRLPRPCGVFAITDDIGAVAISAALRLGLDVPGDVSVVSVDDDPEVCENCTPTLTSVRPDFHRIGFLAAATLRSLLDGGGRARTPRRAVVAPLGVARRASTASTLKPDRKVAEALEFIRLHACEGLRPGRVAELFDCSRRAAELRFKAATGRTIGEEILERRFVAACDYLREGRSTVAAIADFCGWNGDIPFRKAFKARFGVPPLQWRPDAATSPARP